MKWIARADTWVAALPEQSYVVRRFLREKDTTETPSIMGTTCRVVLAWARSLFARLRLERVFASSIFANPVFWCILTVTLAPFLPTMIVLGLALVGYGSFAIALLCKKEMTAGRGTDVKYLYFYALAYALATALSIGRGGSLSISALIVIFTLFPIVILYAIETRNAFRALVGLMVFSGAMVALVGLYQYFIIRSPGSDAWVDGNMFNIAVRAYSTFQNPNILGAYLLLMIPFAGGALLAVRERALRLMILGATLLMGVALILTFSRGAYLGALVAVGLFLILLDRRLIFLGIFGLIVAAVLMPDAILMRFLSIGDMGDTSTTYRVSIWLGTLDMVRDYWLVGIGPGLDTWRLVYPLYAFAATIAHHSHNLFLQILVETGVVGMVLFLCILYHFYKTAFISLSSFGGETRIFAIASISAMTGFLAMGVGDYALYNYRLRLLFWVVLGLGLLNRKLADTLADRKGSA